jgi:hypothetical protein
MNWEAIGATGEVMGAIAVLVTLVYLAVQIRQNTDQAKQANTIARANVTAQLRDRHDALWRQLSADPELAIAINSVMFRDQEANDTDAARLMVWFATYCTVSQNAFYEHKNGLVDDWTLMQLESNVRWFIGNPLFARVYRELLSRHEGTEYKDMIQTWADRIEESPRPA